MSFSNTAKKCKGVWKFQPCSSLIPCRFQWVYLQVKQILDLESEEAIRDRLGKLPRGLEATYDEIYGKIKTRNKHDKVFADRAFMWVMSARHPWTTEELLSNIRWSYEDTSSPASKITESQLLHLCNNLLVLDSQRKVWRFSHLSVAEYFENNYWTRLQADCYIAKTCLSYLIEVYKNPESDNNHDGISDYFGHYSRNNWVKHVEAQNEDEPDPVLRGLLKTFLGFPKESSLQYLRWNQSLSEWEITSNFPPVILPQIRPETSSVWLMCSFPSYTLLSNWWESSDIPLLEKNENGENLLEFAARIGNKSICKVLIKRGIDINVQAGRFGSPLAAASSRGNIEVVSYLIEQGANVNLPLKFGRFDSALCAAVLTANFETVKILVKKGADINSVLYTKFRSIISIDIFWNDHLKIIQFLIEHGADVNLLLQAVPYREAFHSAIDMQNTNAFAFFIGQGADFNIPLGLGFEYFNQRPAFGSVLAAAAANDSTDIINLLIERGVDVDMKIPTGYYGSALAAAANWGQKRSAEILIKAGADVNLRLESGTYRTALEALQAITEHYTLLYNCITQQELEEGRAEVAELLRRAGATG